MGRRAGLLVAAALVLAAAAGCGNAQPQAPNLVAISARLTTSGQPNRAFLEALEREGYEVLVYLAPPTVSDAIAEEPLVVARQGLVYVNIPIDFDAPTAADFRAASSALRAYADRKVHVHCQANFRASSMVFLHRVITLGERPDAAWESVQRAWVPNPTWRRFIVETLKANRVDFEPL